MYSTKKSRHGAAHGSHARAGKPKMMGGAMLSPKGPAHYEGHARSVHSRVDGHVQGAPHSAGIPAATGGRSRAGGLTLGDLPKPRMGSKRGAGGY